MAWVATAVVASAVIGGVAANSAASKQAGAQKQAARTQEDMFNTIAGQEKPFMDAGYGVTSKLSELLGTGGNKGAGDYGSLTKSFSPADFLANKDPGYDFQLKTGAQALRNADTPGVGALSGPALKDLMSFNQGMAATGYQNAFNRFTTQQNNIFSRLSGIAGLGQNAASNTGTAGTSLGTGIAQAQAAAGGSQAAGIVGIGNSLSQGANSLAGLMYLNGGGGGGQFTPDANLASGIQGTDALAGLVAGGGG